MATRSALPSNWELPPEIKDRLGDQVGRQRAMSSKDHLLLVVHQPPKPDDTERKGRCFWRKPDGTWISDELGTGPGALTRHLEECESLVEELEEQDNTADTPEDYFAVLYALAPLHRMAQHLHQALQQAREMRPDDRHIINCRDRAYRLERVAELLHNDVQNALQFAIAKRTEEQAESSHRMATSAHRLNVLAAFFFPIATLSAVFGVNIKHGLEDMPAPAAFLVLLAVGLLCGLILKVFVTRSPGREE